MNKKLISFVAASAITLTSLAAMPVLAKGGYYHDEQRLEHMVKKLDLTEQQKQELSGIQEANKASMRKAMESRKALHQAMMALDPSAPDYQKKLKSLADKAAQQARAMVRNKGEQKAELYAVLTPEQEKKFEAMQSKRQEKMQDRFKEGHHGKGKQCR